MKIGNTDIASVKMGNVDVVEIRMGSSLVWQKLSTSATTNTVQEKKGIFTGMWSFFKNIFKIQ